MKCCDCKVEEAVILTKDRDVFCLDCYKQNVRLANRRKTEFEYPDEITILEGKEKHVFEIQHTVVEEGFLWIGKEQNGFYEGQHLGNMEESYEKAYLDFIEKLVDTVYTKTLKKTFMSNTWNVFKKELEDVHMAAKGQFTIREDDLGRIYFVVDGKSFTPEEFANLLAPYKDMSMQFQLRHISDPLLKEDQDLLPVQFER